MEKLYNNIVLEDDFMDAPSDASHVPYLENPPEVINVSVGRQLFVDDFLIEKTDLKPEYHKAVKYEGNPVLFPETPWELEDFHSAVPFSGGVWYDEKDKKVKIWYESDFLHQVCYAESEDGIHFERPDLGIEPGTNKILCYEGYDIAKKSGDIHYIRPDHACFIIDDSCDPSERYKLFMTNPAVGPGHGFTATSADGIHFNEMKFTTPIGDASSFFYNPFRKKWVISIREYDEKNTRIRHYRETDNLYEDPTWDKKDEHNWMRCDELDKPNPYIGFQPQLYKVDAVGYESIMLGMFQIMYGPENEINAAHGCPKITELIPMYSRDGFHFSRPCRDSIISASYTKGTWDRGYIHPCCGMTIIHGDELWMYYGAFAGDENRITTKADNSEGANGMYCNSATGLAKLRRDGFVSMNGKGSLLTRKLEVNGKTGLYINAIGQVSVEVLDEDGKLLAESLPFKGDSTKAQVLFDRFDVTTLNDRVFRLRFHVDGKLYSFGFVNENGNFGGGHGAGIMVD